MEELIPEYNENIIVGVIYNNIFDWYVTDKEIWFLDYKKRINAFKEKGVPVKEEYIDENRKNILILNTENAKFFLNRIKKYKISSRKLRVLLQQSINSNDDSWFYDFRPSLYVNFDTCKLFSIYSEPASFEEYVPLDWEGKYFDFMDIIPSSKKYWVDEKNQNLLRR